MVPRVASERREVGVLSTEENSTDYVRAALPFRFDLAGFWNDAVERMWNSFLRICSPRSYMEIDGLS